jgi:hypothetical protein
MSDEEGSLPSAAAAAAEQESEGAGEQQWHVDASPPADDDDGVHLVRPWGCCLRCSLACTPAACSMHPRRMAARIAPLAHQ